MTVEKGGGWSFEMRRGVKLLLCALVMAGGISEVKAQDRPAIARPDKPTKKAKKSESSKKTEKTEKSSGEEVVAAKGPSVDIGKILPEGRSLRGVKLPSYTGDRLSSVMTALTMKRLDEKHLDMGDLRIKMYAKPGEKDTLISTERGIYDLEKEEITSDTRTRIEQEGVFDLEGDEMVFDAVTQKGKMTGNVKMLLYNADDSLMPKESGDEKKKENREGDGK